jgi:histidine triad (HIT) family protein
MTNVCVFCQIAAGNRPDGVVAYEDDVVCVFASRDQRPRNHGHMLVITRDHHRNLYDLPPSLDAPLMARVRLVAGAVQRAFGATGTSIQQNNEPPGQYVFHLHFHVIPHHGDTGQGGVPSGPYQVVDLDIRVAQAEAVKAALSTGQRDF